MRVWIDGSQLEDTGESFSIGSKVEWNLVALEEKDRAWLSRPLGADVVNSISHYAWHTCGADCTYEHVVTRGLVTSITAAHYEHEKVGEFELHPAPDSATYEARDRAGEWDAEGWNYLAGGYLVELAALDEPRGLARSAAVGRVVRSVTKIPEGAVGHPFADAKVERHLADMRAALVEPLQIGRV